MTTTYTFEDLKADVKKEAEALRVHATKEERERLDISILRPENMSRCIYGQMTGNCFNPRAATLIDKCAVKYFRDGVIGVLELHGFERIHDYVNGSTVEDFITSRTRMRGAVHFSAIEAYILLPEARNANLIAYLRGETETLDL